MHGGGRFLSSIWWLVGGGGVASSSAAHSSPKPANKKGATQHEDILARAGCFLRAPAPDSATLLADFQKQSSHPQPPLLARGRARRRSYILYSTSKKTK